MKTLVYFGFLVGGRMYLTYLAALAALGVVEASLTVPALVLSPLGVPAVMGPAGMIAAKLAVGTKLLNMLGYLGVGDGGSLLASPIDTLQRYPFLGFNFPQYERFPDQYRSLPITQRSKEFSGPQFSKRRGPNIPTSFNIREATPTEIENFFGVLHRVDANKCISRLVCEIGANPKVLEGLGHNVKEVISSLRVLEKNKLSTKYREILVEGQKNGPPSCVASFPTCDEKAYRLVRTFVRAFRIKRSS